MPRLLFGKPGLTQDCEKFVVVSLGASLAYTLTGLFISAGAAKANFHWLGGVEASKASCARCVAKPQACISYIASRAIGYKRAACAACALPSGGSMLDAVAS